MRVGINLLYLVPGVVGGTEAYAAGLLNGLAEVGGEHEYCVFVARDAADWPLPDGGRFRRVVCPVPASRRWARVLYEQTAFPRRLGACGLDLLHSLGYVGPLWAPCPTLVTLPDTNFLDLHVDMTPWRGAALSLLSTHAARRARCVIAPSGFSRQRISRGLAVPGEHIFVTPLAAAIRRDAGDALEWSALRRQYGVREPYIAAFAGLALHKNIPRLIAAHQSIRAQIPHSLVVLGHAHAADVRASRAHTDAVTLTGHVPDGHIEPLLRHADAFVFASLYEGFGLPILEAQQAGLPVACSRAAAAPETAGDGAEFFDPESVESMAGAILRVLRDADLRAQLRRRGAANAARFSWRQCARQTLAAYRFALGGTPQAAVGAAPVPGG